MQEWNHKPSTLTWTVMSFWMAREGRGEEGGVTFFLEFENEDTFEGEERLSEWEEEEGLSERGDEKEADAEGGGGEEGRGETSCSTSVT